MLEKILTKSPLPRYYQARKKLEASILGFYAQGDKLPPEKDLARQLGVSLITVRKALADMQDDGIIEKHWGKGVYVKNIKHIRNVVRKKIALTILHGEEELGHPAMAAIISGLGEELDRVALDLELAFITQDMLQNDDYSAIANRNLDGLIASVVEMSEKSLNVLRGKIPHVIILNRLKSHPAIVFDYEDGVKKIIEHLYCYGHRKIALIGGIAGTTISERIRCQYKTSLEEFGMAYDERLVKFGLYTKESGSQLTREIIESGEVSALIMGDDNMAVGALNAIVGKGLVCPRDISVCSFNDFPIASAVTPNLTTFKVPFRNIGKMAGEMMIKLLNGLESEPIMKVRGILIPRDSTAEYQKNHDLVMSSAFCK